MIDLTGDLREMMAADEFSIAATLDGVPVKGVFVADYAEVLGVESSGPVFACAAADAPHAAQGGTLAMGAATYRIINIQPDGTGLVRLRLASTS